MDNVLDFLAGNPLAAVIAAGEIGFWVFIVGGLVARYVLRLRRTGLVLLAATPLLDVGVLVATMIDVAGGARANEVHGIAAAYLGFSIVFGPSMVRWADARFAHRFAGGPPPPKRAKRGPARTRYEWREWGKCVLACAITASVLLVLIFVVGTPERTTALWSGWLPRLGLLTGIWFVVGPLWQVLTPAGEKEMVES
ncbi:hypothetical protein [Amycolatopsis aidingensis]|uniref:hypothetical protein n=1 Tax=Amycolatopsis aidingensis TaxID=2842453 RepID=UPI001C0C9423|nr:hypothetical protein [Amycolatopsis aidingensis]